jgi:cytochrome bd-type quinol oxidase subunit 2
MALGLGIARWPLLPRLWRWRGHILELALFIGAYLIYRFTRGLGPSDLETAALANAAQVIGLERSLGFLWEPGWQSWATDTSKALVGFFNWVYIITYWPIIMATALAAYVFDRRRYYYYRSVVMISLAGALLVFALFPLAPPRLAPEGSPAAIARAVRACFGS